LEHIGQAVSSAISATDAVAPRTVGGVGTPESLQLHAPEIGRPTATSREIRESISQPFLDGEMMIEQEIPDAEHLFRRDPSLEDVLADQASALVSGRRPPIGRRRRFCALRTQTG